MYLDFIKFFFQASNAHGIHSPFIFDFYNKIFKSKFKEPYYKEIENFRTKLLHNHNEIVREDFGAGRKNKSKNVEKISDLAKSSSKGKKWSQLLNKIITYNEYKNIIELGTSFGITTAYLAKTNSNSQIFTFEGCPSTVNIAKDTFENLKINNVTIIEGSLDKTLEKALGKIDSIDFAFFDANHKKESTIDYFLKCLLKKNENSCFVFDDIYWSEGMKEAWYFIKKHPEVSISIDLFFIGIVFFRKGIIKQHFKLK